jgi:hypothetical protein
MHALGETSDHGLNVRGECAAGTELISEALGLSGGGDLGGEEKPDKGLRDGLTLAGDTRKGRELLLALRDGETTETNTLVGVEKRSLVVHALNVTSTTDALVDSDFTHGHSTVLSLKLLHLGLLGRYLGGKDFLD